MSNEGTQVNRKQHILFVCEKGIHRSPHHAIAFASFLESHGWKHKAIVRSVGYATNQFHAELLRADHVVPVDQFADNEVRSALKVLEGPTPRVHPPIVYRGKRKAVEWKASLLSSLGLEVSNAESRREFTEEDFERKYHERLKREGD